MNQSETTWFQACPADAVPAGGSVNVRTPVGQIALFRSGNGLRWYAARNRCPHWGEEVLWRGLVEENEEQVSIVCPIHKKKYSLQSGACLAGDAGSLQIYAVRLHDAWVEIDLASA